MTLDDDSRSEVLIFHEASMTRAVTVRLVHAEAVTAILRANRC